MKDLVKLRTIIKTYKTCIVLDNTPKTYWHIPPHVYGLPDLHSPAHLRPVLPHQPQLCLRISVFASVIVARYCNFNDVAWRSVLDSSSHCFLCFLSPVLFTSALSRLIFKEQAGATDPHMGVGGRGGYGQSRAGEAQTVFFGGNFLVK